MSADISEIYPGYTFKYLDHEFDDDGNVINEIFSYCDADNDSDNEEDFVKFSEKDACVKTKLDIAGKN